MREWCRGLYQKDEECDGSPEVGVKLRRFSVSYVEGSDREFAIAVEFDEWNDRFVCSFARYDMHHSRNVMPIKSGPLLHAVCLGCFE